MDKQEKPRWEVRQAVTLDYVMSCPCCGFSFIQNEITVKKLCPGCGAVLADGDRVLRISGGGKLISSDKGRCEEI